MPEDQQAATEQPQTPPSEGSTGEQPALPDLDRATVLALLDKYGDDPDFRKEAQQRRWVGGIAGEVAKTQREAERQQAAREALEKAHGDMRKLATDDPVAFAEKWLSADDVAVIRSREAGLRETTRAEFTKQIGDALQDMPEFRELTEADFKQLRESLAGVTDDKVLGVFVKKATDLVSDKRAAKQLEATVQKRLADEKKAWQREQADKALQRRAAPRAATPPAGSAHDDGEPADFTSKEWAAWYDRQRKAGRLAAAR